MVPGGTTESIAHFIGYLHLYEATTRTHFHYDGGPANARPDGWSDTHHRESAPDRSLPDLFSSPVALNYRPGDFSLISVAKHKLLPPPKISLPHPHLGHAPPVDPTPHDPSLPSDFGFRSGTVYEGVAPAPLPDQLLADLRQANVLHSDGIVLTAPATSAFTALVAAHDADASDQIPGLVDQAQASTPGWLVPADRTETLVQAVKAHDADAAAHAGPFVQPGVYTDGTAEPAGTPFTFKQPAAADTPNPSHNGLTNPGAEAHTGDNTAINVASILDDHTQHTGLAVLGNSYTTDLIAQTNVLHSRVEVVAGGTNGQPDIETGGNTAHNLASFAHHDLSASFVASGTPWSHLQVDTIQGDFYDVKAFSQINYISSNDIVSQSESSAFSQISTGGNVQANVLSFSELAQNYDLIIVGGNFHNTNAIVQQNVFLNDDVVRMFSGRGDTADQSIATGGNSLSNGAAIDHYGTTTTQPLQADLAAWLSHIESGSLDDGPTPLASVGSPLMHVLYITGDFFDINQISQTNIVSNVDTVAQMMPKFGTGVAPNGEPTTSTMTIDVGHNQLANLASIAVVGTTSGFQFAGGQHYDDAILVQANLVSDKAHVTIGDTHTLATEVIAFAGAHDAMPAIHEPVAHLPVDSSLHHDLFHGIMT